MGTYIRRPRFSGLLSGMAAVTLLLLGGAGPAAADWISIRPEGGAVSTLALNPQTPTTLYAGTEGGEVFKWTASPQTLTVGKAGSGSGTVTSNPPGIDCGTECREHYAAGIPVALTATPSAGSSFAAWSGDCTGTGSCVVPLNQPRSVTATFAPPPTVTITASEPLATEGGRTKGVFTFTRTGSTASAFPCYYSVTGTATPGWDYTTTPPFNYATHAGSITIPAGKSTASITVIPVADRAPERTESVIVTLSPHTSYTVGSPNTARVVILNEDPFPRAR